MGLISRVSSRTYRHQKPPTMLDTINRTSTPPFLLRVSYRKTGNFNRTSSFEPKSRDKPEHEVDIYTWRDATLKELLRDIVAEANDTELNLLGTEFVFGTVYPHVRDGRYDIRQLGKLKRDSPTADEKTQPFRDGRFVVGDRMDIAVVLPRIRTYCREKSKSKSKSRSRSNSRSRSRSPIGPRAKSDDDNSMKSSDEGDRKEDQDMKSETKSNDGSGSGSTSEKED